MAQSSSNGDRILRRSTVSATIPVSAAQAQNKYMNSSGQPNSVAPANSHSTGGLNRTRPRAKSPTSRSLRRASRGMTFKPVLMRSQSPRHVGCGDELAEAGDAEFLAAIQPAYQDRRRK